MKNSNTLMVYVECDEFAPINVSLEALSKGVELGKTNNLDVIPKITCPLYFIVGNEDEPRPPKESLEMSKLNKNSKYIVVENAGHISNLDNAKFVNKIFSEIFKL